MQYLRRYGKSILILLFPAICWLFINNAINRHSHLLTSGDIVSHAHPYQKEDTNKSPFQSHHHSGSELIILNLVSNILVILCIPFIINFSKKFLKEIITKPGSIPICLNTYTSQNYRGPPVVI